MDRRASKLLTWVMAAAAAAQLAAQVPTAMLYPEGMVLVDGNRSLRPVALTDGAKVQTAERATATLNAHGSTVLLFPDSSLIYRDRVLELACGDVRVTTLEKRISLRVGNLSIEPVSDVSRFEVAEGEGKLQIAARQGGLAVSDGQQNTELAEGKLMTFGGVGDCQRKLTQAPASPAHFALRKSTLALLLGGGSAAVIGITAARGKGGGGENPPPVSPSVP